MKYGFYPILLLSLCLAFSDIMTTASAVETESVFSAEKKVEGRSVRVDMEFPHHAAVGETVPLTVALSFDRQISGAFPSVSVTWKKNAGRSFLAGSSARRAGDGRPLFCPRPL